MRSVRLPLRSDEDSRLRSRARSTTARRPAGTLAAVDIRTLPFVRFDGNEAHTHRRFALNLGGIRHVSDQADYETIHTPGTDRSRIQGGDVQGVGPDWRHPFKIRNYLVWN